MESAIETGQHFNLGDMVGWGTSVDGQLGKITGIQKEVKYLIESQQGKYVWVYEKHLHLIRKKTMFDQIDEELQVRIPLPRTLPEEEKRVSILDVLKNTFESFKGNSTRKP
jgi:hypothetical protein